MIELTSTFGLTFDQLVVFRVSASNMMGQGPWSLSNTSGAKTRQVPAQMQSVTKGSESTASSLQINWVGLYTPEETGNSEILGFQLFWDANSGSANIKLFEAQPNEFTYSVHSLVAGLEYQFKVRAENIYGYGDFSELEVVIPDAVPAMMNAITTSMSYPLVTFMWEEPFYNGREITSYQLEIYSNAVMAYLLDASVCDATTTASMDTLSCDVDMSTLIDQYAYVRG